MDCPTIKNKTLGFSDGNGSRIGNFAIKLRRNHSNETNELLNPIEEHPLKSMSKIVMDDQKLDSNESL